MLLNDINPSLATSSFADYLAVIDETQKRLFDAFAQQYSVPAARLLALKVSNLLVAKYEWIHRHSVLLSRPFGLIIDPVNNCNLHCPGCVHSRSETVKNIGFDWPSGMLREEYFQCFLHGFVPYALQIAFYSNGEPFLNTQTADYIQRARAFGVMSTTSSNLSHRKFNAKAIVASGLDYITLSIDGATAEVYSMFRRGGDFNLVMQNVRELVKEKRRQKSKTPTLAWQFLIFRHNRHQRELVRQLAIDEGADILIYAKPMSVAWDDAVIADDDTLQEEYCVVNLNDIRSQSLRGRITARLKKNLGEPKQDSMPEIERVVVGADAEVIERLFARRWSERLTDAVSEDVEGDAQRRPCEWLFKNMTVDAKGRVMPCCRAPARSDRLDFGRITDDDPFNSVCYQQAREYYVRKDHGGHNRSAEDALFCWKCPHPNLGALTNNQHIGVFFRRFDSKGVLEPSDLDVLERWDEEQT